MAHLPRLDTSFFGRSIAPPLESAFLCDRFWGALFLDSDEFLDDISMSCNDDCSPFEEHSLTAFDRVCRIGGTGSPPADRLDSAITMYDDQRSKSTPPVLQNSLTERPEAKRNSPRAVAAEDMPTSLPMALPRIITTPPPHQVASPKTAFRNMSPTVERFAETDFTWRWSPKASSFGWTSIFGNELTNLGLSRITSPQTAVLCRENIRFVESDVQIGIVEGVSETDFWTSLQGHYWNERDEEDRWSMHIDAASPETECRVQSPYTPLRTVGWMDSFEPVSRARWARSCGPLALAVR